MRLQGFPDNYRIVISDTQMKKVVGNTVSVTMIQAVAKNLVESLENALMEYNKNIKISRKAWPCCIKI